MYFLVTSLTFSAKTKGEPISEISTMNNGTIRGFKMQNKTDSMMENRLWYGG